MAPGVTIVLESTITPSMTIVPDMAIALESTIILDTAILTLVGTRNHTFPVIHSLNMVLHIVFPPMHRVHSQNFYGTLMYDTDPSLEVLTMTSVRYRTPHAGKCMAHFMQKTAYHVFEWALFLSKKMGFCIEYNSGLSALGTKGKVRVS